MLDVKDQGVHDLVAYVRLQPVVLVKRRSTANNCGDSLLAFVAAPGQLQDNADLKSQVSLEFPEFSASYEHCPPPNTNSWGRNYRSCDPQLEASWMLTLEVGMALVKDESEMGVVHDDQPIPDGEPIEKDVHGEGEVICGAWVNSPNR